MKKIIIFGTGEFGKNIYKINKNKYNILFFCDNNNKKHNTYINNIKVISPSQLLTIQFDLILIASTYVEEIYMQLINELHIKKSLVKKLYVNQSNVQFYNDDKRINTEIFIKYIVNILKKNNIQYYIDHGTLLGIVRDKALIPWDKDVDISILAKDRESIVNILNDILPKYIHPKCKENNWQYKIAKEKMKIGDSIQDIIIEIQISNNSTFISELIVLDIMFRYEYNGKLYWKVAQKELCVDYNICFPLSTIQFKNDDINVPGQTDKYLEILFGNWKKIDKKWSYEKYNNLIG